VLPGPSHAVPCLPFVQVVACLPCWMRSAVGVPAAEHSFMPSRRERGASAAALGKGRSPFPGVLGGHPPAWERSAERGAERSRCANDAGGGALIDRAGAAVRSDRGPQSLCGTRETRRHVDTQCECECVRVTEQGTAEPWATEQAVPGRASGVPLPARAGEAGLDLSLGHISTRAGKRPDRLKT
jgi:hypothetical protein